MPTIVKVEPLYQGYSRLFQVTLREDDGHEVSQQVEDHGRAVAVLAYDPERRVALVVEVARPAVRYAGHEGEFFEPVAGMIDDGETPEQAIRREAMEEAGLRLRELDRVRRVFSTPGVSTETLELYLATYRPDDRLGDGGGTAAENERLRASERSFAQLLAGVEARTTLDAKLLILLQALQLRRPELFRAP